MSKITSTIHVLYAYDATPTPKTHHPPPTPPSLSTYPPSIAQSPSKSSPPTRLLRQTSSPTDLGHSFPVRDSLADRDDEAGG